MLSDYGETVNRWQALQGGTLMIVVGEVLLVVCSLSYLIWWTMSYRPSVRTPPGAGLFLAGAVLGGLGGLVLLAVGIVALLPKASLPALGATIVGGGLVGALLFYVTSGLAHRPVTTELPLIVVWATAQLAAGITLRTAGELTASAASAWIVAVAIATLVGLVCYLVFYRLDPIPAYWLGMVPLAVDGLVAAILAATVTLTRAP
ncbi:hypothetical protein SAMN04489747_2074 [Auraticoccus monumenti]|uniref:Uncharacterized protein n=1 Tax=Auraticoccus monumenti TaxID=675864 RepID=A0A1G6YQT6_9ACTN|nr:hypothetical protein SAMN04489747_2074 [Auraticoccus monumenti]